MSPNPRLKIVFSSIANRGITLVSHQVDDVEISPEVLQEVQESIRTLDHSSEQKITFPVDSLQIHVLADSGIAYMCITACTDTAYLPFFFLREVKESFSAQPSLISRSYTAGVDEFDRDFRPVLVNIMEKFNSGRGDKVSEIDGQIEDVKRIMLRNVEKVMDRGDRLDDLLSKTEELESQGQEFRRQARTVLVQARCKNLKLWLVIGVLFSIFLTIVILFATGVIKS